MHQHVCNTWPQIRERLCDSLLQVDINGFTYDSSTHLKCKPRSCTIQFQTLAKPTECKLSYFSCPQLWYIDLETGVKKSWPYIYNVSNAKEYDSAILFVQRDVEAKKNILYPQQYIKHINFKELKFYEVYKLTSSSSVELEMFEKSKDDITTTYIPKKHATSRK